MDTSTSQIGFADLLSRAVNEPGIISSAYRQFHNYSLGNILLAAVQCAQRGLALGPMATYPRWKALERQVRKGEKALTLCQPVTIKRKAEEGAQDDQVQCALEQLDRLAFSSHARERLTPPLCCQVDGGCQRPRSYPRGWPS